MSNTATTIPKAEAAATEPDRSRLWHFVPGGNPYDIDTVNDLAKELTQAKFSLLDKRFPWQMPGAILPSSRWDIWQREIRKFTETLKPVEFAALAFIYDRTIGFGKLFECIPWRHVRDGIGTPGDDCRIAGVNISRRAWAYAIESFNELNIIVVSNELAKVPNRGAIIGINLPAHWVFEALEGNRKLWKDSTLTTALERTAGKGADEQSTIGLEQWEIMGKI